MQRVAYAYCSEVEARERQSRYDIDPLEATEATKLERRELREHDPLKIIKKFNRSAAGEDMQSKYASSRSNEELYSCALYLQDLWNINKNNAFNTYGFIMDRIRAIRQEIVIENITVDSYKVVDILDVIVSFYIQSWEDIIVLGSRNSAWFDEVLHQRALSSCLASIISIGDANVRYTSYIIYLNISHVLKQELVTNYTTDNKYCMRFSTLSLYDFVKNYHYFTDSSVLKAIKCIITLQQGNIDGTVQFLENESDKIIRSLYFLHILPYLRLWRYLLIGNSINVKGEELMVIEELARRLYMTKAAAELMLSHSNIAVDASTSTLSVSELNQVPVKDLLNSLLLLTSRGI